MILLVFFWTSISDSTSADHSDYPRYPWWRRPGWAQGTGTLFTLTQGADFKPTKPWWPRYPEGGFCRSLIKVKFSTDKVRRALGSCGCLFVVTMLKNLKTALFQTFST